MGFALPRTSCGWWHLLLSTFSLLMLAGPVAAQTGVWKGTIGKSPVTACIEDNWSGGFAAYYYDRYGSEILLLAEGRNFREETDGTVTGRWQNLTVADRVMRGQWLAPAGKKPLPLLLRQVAREDKLGNCRSPAYMAGLREEQAPAAPGDTSQAPTVRQVAAGYDHSCAVLGDGEVRCWGGNFLGQAFASHVPVASTTPVPVPAVSRALAVAAGHGHSCALLQRGMVRCWGYSSAGEAGDNVPSPATFQVDYHDALRATDIPGVIHGVAIAVGREHSCVLLAGGRVQCWGSNRLHQLGPDDLPAGSLPYSSKPRFVRGIEEATALAAGFHHTCARRKSGGVSCWGDNRHGQGGTDDGNGQVAGVAGATAVAAGGRHSCALLASGRVACWGDDSHGQLGGAKASAPGAAVLVPGVDHAVALAAGAYFTCALHEDRTASCWGDDISRAAPVPPTPARRVAGVEGAVAITAGHRHACIVDGQGQARCWGDNAASQLGGDTVGPTLPPLLVGGLNTPARAPRTGPSDADLPWTGKALAIAAGGRHSCVVVDNGEVRCWGSNRVAQLGNGEMNFSASPVRVHRVSQARAVAAGSNFSCALLKGGSAMCWGFNLSGRLGNGLTGGATLAEPVQGLAKAVDLSLGDRHACALLATGQVMCWGANDAGQLGFPALEARPAGGYEPVPYAAGPGTRPGRRAQGGRRERRYLRHPGGSHGELLGRGPGQHGPPPRSRPGQCPRPAGRAPPRLCPGGRRPGLVLGGQ